jgi:hypothetical protein
MLPMAVTHDDSVLDAALIPWRRIRAMPAAVSVRSRVQAEAHHERTVLTLLGER